MFFVSTPSCVVVVVAHATTHADADDARSDANASASCFEAGAYAAAYAAADDAKADAKMLNDACRLDGAYDLVLLLLSQPSLTFSDSIWFLVEYSSCMLRRVAYIDIYLQNVAKVLFVTSRNSGGGFTRGVPVNGVTNHRAIGFYLGDDCYEDMITHIFTTSNAISFPYGVVTILLFAASYVNVDGIY